ILVVLIARVVVEGVLIDVLAVVRGVRAVGVGAPRFRSDAQLLAQPVEVGAAAVVLKLASNLNLLGLGSAAPHWLDPLERPEPCGPTMPLSLAVTHTDRRRSRLGNSAPLQLPYRYNRTRFAALMTTPIDCHNVLTHRDSRHKG